MSFLDRFRASDTNAPLSNRGFSMFANLLGADTTKVTPANAQRITTVFACNRVLAETISSIGLHLYKINGKSKDRYPEHTLYDLISRQPNPMMTSIQWREAIVTDINLRGNHYSQIIRNGRGDVIALYPLVASNMKVLQSESGDIVYRYTTRDGAVDKTSYSILHIPGVPSGDGITGISPIEANRRALQLGVTAERFGQNFFDNGANAAGAFSVPGELSDEAYNRLKKDLKEERTGVKNSASPLLLEGGMDFKRFTISPNDSQFLETRKYQKEEIASIYRVPMHMINALDKATFSNIEHQSLEFIKFTILPWVRRIELALETAILSREERKSIRISFNVDTLLRGDFKTRTEGYATLFNIGAISQNEIRHLENFNPIDEGDRYYVQLNMSPTNATKGDK